MQHKKNVSSLVKEHGGEKKKTGESSLLEHGKILCPSKIKSSLFASSKFHNKFHANSNKNWFKPQICTVAFDKGSFAL